MQSFIKCLALAAAVSATTIPIHVGEDGIKFAPDNVTASVGDILEFHFYAKTGPHSVVVGDFSTPCLPSTSSASFFYSGLLNGTSSGNVTYSVAVSTTDPIWYYCSEGHHCNGGMVGVINPPPNATVAEFAAAAKVAAAVSAPASLVSGTVATGSATATATGIVTSTGVSTTSTGGASSSTSSSSSAAAASSTGAAVSNGNAKAGGALAALAGGLALLI